MLFFLKGLIVGKKLKLSKTFKTACKNYKIILMLLDSNMT